MPNIFEHLEQSPLGTATFRELVATVEEVGGGLLAVSRKDDEEEILWTAVFAVGSHAKAIDQLSDTISAIAEAIEDGDA